MEYGGILFSWANPKALMGVIVLIALLVFGFVRRKKDPMTFFAIYWFFIALLPSSNLYALNAYMAEHWLYVPSVGFLLLVARPLAKWYSAANSRTLAISVFSVLVVIGSALTIRQNKFWSDPIIVYGRLLTFAPHSSRLYNNLAKAYNDAGRKDDLIKLLKQAIAINPHNVEAYNNLGNVYKELERYDDAIRSYKKALELMPNLAGPHYNLSLIYYDVHGNAALAKEELHKAIEHNPYYTDAYHKMGLILFKEGKGDEAIGLLQKAIKLNPDKSGLYHSLGYFYVMSDNPDMARKMYLKTIEIDPNHSAAHHDLAVLAYSLNDYKTAIAYADRAALLGHMDEGLMKTLASHRNK